MPFLFFWSMLFLSYSVFAHEMKFNNGTEQEYKKAASLIGDVREIQNATRDLWPRIAEGKEYQVGDNNVSVTENDNFLIFKTNNLPDHQLTTTNPNCAKEQNYKFLIPKNPRKLNAPLNIASSMQEIGIALNGVVIAGPYDSQNKIAPYNRVVDQCASHSDPQGMYHYHFAPLCMKNIANEEFVTNPLIQIGWSFDGYKIKGLADRKTHYPEIDICNGHEHDGEYHYHATRDFPFFMGCYAAKPQSSNFNQKRAGANSTLSSCSGLMTRTSVLSGKSQSTKDTEIEKNVLRKRPNFKNAFSVLNIPERELKKALGPPPGNINKASKELHISKELLLEALQLN